MPGAGGQTDVVLDLGDAVDDVTSPTHDLAKDKGGYTLHDANRDLVGMALLLVRVLQELLRDRLGMDAVRHEIVAFVAEHADDLGREGLVQDPHDDLGVGAVALGNGAALDVLARAAADRLDVGQKRLLLLVRLPLLHAPLLLRDSDALLVGESSRVDGRPFRALQDDLTKANTGADRERPPRDVRHLQHLPVVDARRHESRRHVDHQPEPSIPAAPL